MKIYMVISAMITLFLIIACSNVFDDDNTNLMNDDFLKGEYYEVNQDYITFADDFHTQMVKNIITDDRILTMIAKKRNTNEYFFTSGELSLIDSLSLSIVEEFIPISDLVDKFVELQQAINDVSYIYNNDNFNFSHDFSRLIDNYSKISRDYNDLTMRPIYKIIDDCMSNFSANSSEIGIYSATIIANKELNDLSKMVFSEEVYAVETAMLIGITKSTISLAEDYRTLFGIYSSDPLTFEQLGLAWDADTRFFGGASTAVGLLPPIPLPWPWVPGFIVGGSGICSATILVMNWIHGANYLFNKLK
jgi:hypothetical protein